MRHQSALLIDSRQFFSDWKLFLGAKCHQFLCSYFHCSTMLKSFCMMHWCTDPIQWHIEFYCIPQSTLPIPFAQPFYFAILSSKGSSYHYFAHHRSFACRHVLVYDCCTDVSYIIVFAPEVFCNFLRSFCKLVSLP
jgi:hypothetical protein